MNGHLAVPGIEAAYGSLAGFKQGANEDAVHVVAWSNGSGEGLICVIADGVGATTGAADAARATVEGVARSFAASAKSGALDTPSALHAAIANAHERVRGVSGAGLDDGEATVVAAAVRADSAYFANVGDSRAYLYAHGSLQQVTRDHSWVQEQVRAGSLSPEQATGHPWRSLITRSVGGAAPPAVDIFERRLVPGSRVLLCSDGLGKVVGDEELATALERGPATATIGALLALATKRGASDDVTVCVVDLGPGGAARAEQTHG